MKTGPRQHRLTARRALSALVALVVVGVSFGVVLPRLAPYGAVWHNLRGLSPGWAAVLLGAVVLNVCSFAAPWMVVIPELGFVRALLVTQASTAFTLVAPGGAPAGMAVSYASLRASGYSASQVTRAVALTGAWNQLSSFAFPGIAFVYLAAAGIGNGSITTIALVGAGLFGAFFLMLFATLANENLTRHIGAVLVSSLNAVLATLGRPPTRLQGESAVAFRRESLDLLRTRWHLLTAATFFNQLTSYLVLVVAFRAIGGSAAHVDVGASFAAWSAGRLLTSIPFTPGGVGYTEVGLIGILFAFGAQHSAVVAAVFLYRALSIAPTVLVGAIATVWLGRPQHT